mmetsp:Transcript_65303/g.165448  ORF Transcript_65303/g.165448 Transcript_65303/m.165448 type:complete len:277 (+) Transcript_65303:73-903(+)
MHRARPHGASKGRAQGHLQDHRLPLVRAVDPRPHSVAGPVGRLRRTRIVGPVPAPLAGQGTRVPTGTRAVATDAPSVMLLVQCLGARAIPDRVLGRPEVAREPDARPEARRATRRGKTHLGPGVRARELPRGGVQRLVSAGSRKPEPSRVVRVRAQIRASTGPITVQLDVVIAPRSILQAPRQAGQVLGAPALDAGGLAGRDPAAPAEELDALGAMIHHNEALDPHAPDTGLLPSHCLLHPGRGQVAKGAVPRSPTEGGRRGANLLRRSSESGARD